MSAPETKTLRWDKKRLKAIRLVADDKLSDDEIAATCGFSPATLGRLKAHPEFRARLQEYLDAWREKVMSTGIADRVNRIQALDDMLNAQRQIQRERGAAVEMQDVPGGRTGLIVKQFRSVGFGENNQLVEEFVYDRGLAADMRQTMQQAAQETGQWTEKREVNATLNGSLKLELAVTDAILEAIDGGSSGAL